MIQENSIKLSASYLIAGKVKDYYQLTKFTLSFMVVFSCVVGYLMVPGVPFDLGKVLLLFIGGLCITGSANAINQIMERDTDALMARTAKRPLPDGRMKVWEAALFAFITGLIGLGILVVAFNTLCALISLISILLYGFIYTPWKKWNSIAVLVGAIPGALPPLIGWAAGANALSVGGWSLFVIQFLWQFPHFWAIAWIAFEDYKKAGFKLLPTGLSGPLGALGVPLTAARSIAVDPFYIPLGAPVYMATTYPYPNSDTPLQQLMMAQDTGGAIKGGVRADIYWGDGEAAGKLAGAMRQQGQLWVWLPKTFKLPQQ